MRGDFLQGLLWLSIGIVVILLSSRYNMGTLSELGPGALPFGLGLVFVLLSAILLFRSWQVKTGHEQRLPFGPKWRKVFLIILFLVLVTFLIESWGYLISVFLLTAIPMLIMDPKRWVSAMLLGVISSISSYVLFDIWLRVPLPKGFFYF